MLDEVGVEGKFRVSLEFAKPRIMLIDYWSRQVIGAMKGVVFAMLSTSESGGEYYVFWYVMKCGNDEKRIDGYKAGDGEE